MYRNANKKWFLSFTTLSTALLTALLAFTIIGKAEGFQRLARSQYMTIREAAQERGYHVEESKETAPSGTVTDHSYSLSKGIVSAGSITFTVEEHTVVSASDHDTDTSIEELLLEDLFVENDEIYLRSKNLNKYFDLLDENVERVSEFVVGPEETQRLLEQYCPTEEDLQYYAHLDYDAAEKDIRRVILVARNQIIFRTSWCDDSVSCRVIGVDGEEKETVPHFHEIFPLDWEPPVHPNIAD